MDEFCYGRILWLADEEELSRLALVNRLFSRIVRDRINSIKYDLTVPVQSMKKLIKRLCRERKIFSVKWFLDNTRLQSYILKWSLKTGNAAIGLLAFTRKRGIFFNDLFFYALYGGNRRLIQITKQYVTGDFLNHNCALFWACKGAHIEAIFFVLRFKYDFDFEYGLAGACYGGDPYIMQMMIDRGAEHTIWTCACATYSNNFDLFQSVYSKLSQTDRHAENKANFIFKYACGAGNLDIVRYCYEKGGGRESFLRNGFSSACSRRRIEVMRFLSDKGEIFCDCGKTVARHFTGNS